MAKIKQFPLGTYIKQFSTEAQCQEYLASLRWKSGYVCPKCGCRHTYRLANGQYQCVKCCHQDSVTAGTLLHKTHMPLTQWFLAFYFMCQDKRGISAVQLAAMIGTTYKTAWFMLRRIRVAMGQRDKIHHQHGLPKRNFQSYLDEYSFCFSRRNFGEALVERLTLSIALSRSAEQKG